MGLKECEIKLDSPINTYYAGFVHRQKLKKSFPK